MNAAVLLDLDDSIDFAGNTGKALGRPLSAYPIMAVKSTPRVHTVYAVTDSPPVRSVCAQHGAVVVDPPQEKTAAAYLRRGYETAKKDLEADGEKLDLLVVLLSNVPFVTRELMDTGIDELETRPDLDSAVTVSPYNRWHPFYAQREGTDGLLTPVVPAASDARGDVWFPDGGVCILRAGSLEKPAGPGPMPWLGKKVLPLKQWAGGPVDYAWQVPGAEYWLRKHGYGEGAPEPMPQPKLQPKSDRR